MLRRHLTSLRALYAAYAFGEGIFCDELNNTRLINYGEWHGFVTDFGLMGRIKERDCQRIFAWSRMTVIAEFPSRARTRGRRM